MLYFLCDYLLKCRVLLKFGFFSAGRRATRVFANGPSAFSEIISLLLFWNWRLVLVLQKTCTLQLEDVRLRELGLDFRLRDLDALYHIEYYSLPNESFLLIVEHLVVGVGSAGA